MTDYVIEAVMDANIGGIDIIDEMYDRAFNILLQPDYPIALDIIDERYARAIQPLMDVETLGVSFNPSKDNAFPLDMEVLQRLGMDADPKISVANRLTLDIEDLPKLAVVPGCDRLGEISVTQDFEADFTPEADRAIGGDVAFGELWGLDVLYLMRSLLNIPPSGEITVLSSISSPGAECLLDGQILEKGVTSILKLEAEGVNLDVYLVELFVYLDPADMNSVLLYKCSDRKLGGGIRVESLAPVINNKEVRQRLTAQIPLEPDDFAAIKQTRTLFYRCLMSQDGMGESYRIAKGKFTVSVE